MDKDHKCFTFAQFLNPINFDKFRELVEMLEVDKYVKKLTSVKVLILLIYAQLFKITSLKHISTLVRCDRDLQKIVQLKTISASQLSRKLRKLPTSLLQDIFKDLVKVALAKNGSRFFSNSLGRINIIDSTTITMAFTQYPWAEFRSTKAGLKLHLRITFIDGDVLPSLGMLSPAKVADCKQMKQLISYTKNVLYIFDRAYVDYVKFDQYIDNGILFVSKLKKNAVYEVIETTTKIIDGKLIRESIVRLGDEVNRMRNNLRLIEIPDDRDSNKTIRIITNDMTRSTKEISDLYRNRWKIELLFKWLKQHFYIKKFYSFGEGAVENQIWAALISFLLLNMLKNNAGTQESLLEVLRVLTICKYKPLNEFIKGVHPQVSQSSKGRRKMHYDEIFELTYQQVMAGEIEHLNNLTYDPLIL